MTKKLLLFALGVVLALTANAYDFMVDGLCYNITGDGKVEVTYKSERESPDEYYPAYSFLSGALTIPPSVSYGGKSYSVTSIGYFAFSHCTSLTSVTIGNSVTSIGHGVFYGCSGLTSVTIPNSVTSIGDEAFHGTAWYNYQPDGLVYAGLVAYHYKGTMPNGTAISLKAGTKGIAGGAFSGCSGLTSVTIPNSVTSIGNSAFSGCSGLTSVTIPNSVTTIGMYAFWGCSGLTSITIPNSVTTIGDYAFYGTAWYNNQPNGLVYAGLVAYTYKGTMPSGTAISLKAGTKGIANYAFSGRSGLTSVTIPNSVTSIGYFAFYGCSGLKSVNISDIAKWCAIKFGNYYANPLSYAHHLYLNGSEVTDLIIPNSVTKIGDYAFSGCTGLTSVTIPNSVTEIGGWAFENCSGLTSMVVKSGNTKYDSRNNCNAIVETATNTLIAGCKNTVIPNSVKTIGGYAFYNCSGLTSMPIPNSVTSIGGNAFSGCTGLTSVTIPNSVTYIGDYAFEGCTGLTSVYAHLDPNNIKLGNYAFLNVPKATCVLYVPARYLDDYKSAYQWKEFTHIKPMNDVINPDVSGDGVVGVDDMNIVINHILGAEDGFNADINGDGEIDLSDLNMIINAILNK